MGRKVGRGRKGRKEGERDEEELLFHCPFHSALPGKGSTPFHECPLVDTSCNYMYPCIALDYPINLPTIELALSFWPKSQVS